MLGCRDDDMRRLSLLPLEGGCAGSASGYAGDLSPFRVVVATTMGRKAFGLSPTAISGGAAQACSRVHTALAAACSARGTRSICFLSGWLPRWSNQPLSRYFACISQKARVWHADVGWCPCTLVARLKAMPFFPSISLNA
jgi:hypothetical protein